MILLEKGSHLLLEAPRAMVRLLLFQVMQQSAGISRTNGESAVTALPCEIGSAVGLHPLGRGCLDLLHKFLKTGGRIETQRKMNVIRRAAEADAIAPPRAHSGAKNRLQRCTEFFMQQRLALFRAENYVDQQEGGRRMHAAEYRWPAQATGAMVLAITVSLAGCRPSPPAGKPQAASEATAQESRFAPRPSVAAPSFKVFHQDNDTYTLVTREDASDDEIAAVLWELRDAARSRGFDKLHLSQTFIDARKPSVWFHVYRGAKCASEKFTKGKLPCEAAYHGAGDYTLGAYHDPLWDDAILHHADATETHLWNPDAGR